MKEQIKKKIQEINDALWELNKIGFSLKLPEEIAFEVSETGEVGVVDNTGSQSVQGSKSNSGTTENVMEGSSNELAEELASKEEVDELESKEEAEELESKEEVDEEKSEEEVKDDVKKKVREVKHGDREVFTEPSEIGSPDEEEMTEELEYGGD